MCIPSMPGFISGHERENLSYHWIGFLQLSIAQIVNPSSFLKLVECFQEYFDIIILDSSIFK